MCEDCTRYREAHKRPSRERREQETTEGEGKLLYRAARAELKARKSPEQNT